MDEITYYWYYYGWVQKQEDKFKDMKDFGCFVGSFINPEMAKKIKDSENNTFAVSDDDMDKAMEFIEANRPIDTKKDLRKKKKLKISPE